MRILLDGDDWQITDLVPSEWAWLPLGRPDTNLDNLQPPPPPWRKARVPGDVQSDLLEAGELPEPWRDLNSRLWEWTSQRDWLYRKRFDVPKEYAGFRAGLRFEGVDYACHVFLNGSKLGTHAGTYVPFELDATDALRAGETNQLVVVVEHAPSEPDQQAQIGWTSKVRLWKPRFAYKWDWCTRLIPLGIWDSVVLHLWRVARLSEVRAAADVDGEGRGVVTVQACVQAAEQATVSLQVEIADRHGATVAEVCRHMTMPAEGERKVTLRAAVPQPELWWPNGLGEQPLYRVCVRLCGQAGEVLDEQVRRVGFRRLRFLRSEGAPEDALTYAVEVNGAKVFLKGWNWAPIQQLYGRPQAERYRHAIRLAREAHCNLLRVWGGGLLERELFYDLCDEAGIMVWQEFPQSSSGIDNEPAREPAYVRYCLEQARKMVPRRVHHPSLIAWCGGNELMDERWVPCDRTHPVLNALGKVVEKEDPGRLYLPTSPSGPVFAADPANKGKMHDVHGHWLYMGDPDHYRFYNEIDPLLHSELGCEGAANLHAIERFLSPEYRWPPDRTNPAWVHHGNWWLHRDKVTGLFGPLDNLRDFVFASQWIQYEGLRYAAEASRRRKWRTSGCAPWQFNESWPNASCTNSLGFFGDVRPAYWAMRGAYAPLSVSLRYEKVRWEPRATLTAEIWWNVSRAQSETGSVEWALWRLDGVEQVAEGRIPLPHILEPSASRVGVVSAKLPTEPGLLGLVLRVRLDGIDPQCSEGLEKRYLFTTCGEPAMAGLAHMPPPDEFLVSQTDRSLCVRVGAAGTSPAVFVRADALEDHAGPYLSAGFYPFLLPGETARIAVDGAGRVAVTAWNSLDRRVFEFG